MLKSQESQKISKISKTFKKIKKSQKSQQNSRATESQILSLIISLNQYYHQVSDDCTFIIYRQSILHAMPWFYSPVLLYTILSAIRQAVCKVDEQSLTCGL